MLSRGVRFAVSLALDALLRCGAAAAASPESAARPTFLLTDFVRNDRVDARLRQQVADGALLQLGTVRATEPRAEERGCGDGACLKRWATRAGADYMLAGEARIAAQPVGGAPALWSLTVWFYDVETKRSVARTLACRCGEGLLLATFSDLAFALARDELQRPERRQRWFAPPRAALPVRQRWREPCPQGYRTFGRGLGQGLTGALALSGLVVGALGFGLQGQRVVQEGVTYAWTEQAELRGVGLGSLAVFGLGLGVLSVPGVDLCRDLGPRWTYGRGLLAGLSGGALLAGLAGVAFFAGSQGRSCVKDAPVRCSWSTDLIGAAGLAGISAVGVGLGLTLPLP